MGLNTTRVCTGAQVSWYQFLVVNLIPVTLGNIVGGSVFVGAIYWFVYEYKMPAKSTERTLVEEIKFNRQKMPNSNPNKL